MLSTCIVIAAVSIHKQSPILMVSNGLKNFISICLGVLCALSCKALVCLFVWRSAGALSRYTVSFGKKRACPERRYWCTFPSQLSLTLNISSSPVLIVISLPSFFTKISDHGQVPMVALSSYITATLTQLLYRRDRNRGCPHSHPCGNVCLTLCHYKLHDTCCIHNKYCTCLFA